MNTKMNKDQIRELLNSDAPKDIIDEDRDGRPETVGLDLNGDGTYDVIAMDTTDDGRLDTAFVDTTADGITDTTIELED